MTDILSLGQKVFVYWNIRKKLYSVLDYKTRRLVCHTGRIKLKDVVFKVSETRRQHVIRTRRKNVHAGLVGRVTGMAAAFLLARYDPYENKTFVDSDGNALLTAEKASLAVRDGRAVVMYH